MPRRAKSKLGPAGGVDLRGGGVIAGRGWQPVSWVRKSPVWHRYIAEVSPLGTKVGGSSLGVSQGPSLAEFCPKVE